MMKSQRIGTTPQPVGVLAKAVKILEILRGAPAGLGLKDIAQQTGINKSTAYRFLSHLERETYLARDEHGHYSLGAKLSPGAQSLRRDASGWPLENRNSKIGPRPPKRYGQLLRLRPEARDAYIRYHESVWPEVLKTIHECNIRNYSIFLKDGLLFAYFEYIGQDYAADMAKMAGDPKTQEWWAIMMPMQEPVPSRAEGEWWANMPAVFHTD